ncbi:MAG: hypothetical protein ACXVRK_03430 [Gaiellaceae bacterium]
MRTGTPAAAIRDLKQPRNAFARRVEEAQVASGAWQELKEGVDKARSELERAIDDVLPRFE